MIVYLGSNELKKVYLGNTEIKKIYVGDKLVFPKSWTPGSNTLLYYPLISNVNDYSGNNRNGTNYNITFNSEGAYFARNANLQIPSSFYSGYIFTLSLWSKTLDNGEFRLFYDWDAPYRNILFGKREGNVFLYYGNGSTSQSNWEGITTYSNNVWEHYVLLKEHNKGTVYKNGVLIGSVTFSYNPQTGGHSGQYGIAHLGTGGSSSLAQGYEREFIIENRLRTANEILEYYNITKSLFGIS